MRSGRQMCGGGLRVACDGEGWEVDAWRQGEGGGGEGRWGATLQWQRAEGMCAPLFLKFFFKKIVTEILMSIR